MKLRRLPRNHALVETKNNAEKGRLTTSATENVVNGATVGTEETEDVVEDVEIHGEEAEGIEISIAEGVVEVEVGGDSIDRLHHDLDLLAGEIRESEDRFGSLRGRPQIHMCQVDVEGDETTVVAHLPQNLDHHLLPDLTRHPVPLLAGAPAPYPAPVLLPADDPGHLTGGTITVLVEAEAGEAAGTVESVVDHQVQTHLVLALQGLADAEDPPLFLHLHILHQDPETPVVIAALAPDPFLAHARDHEALTLSWVVAETGLDPRQPQTLMKTSLELERIVTNVG